MAHVSAGDAPHFIFQGDGDTVLRFDQAEGMAAALPQAGVPVTLLFLPDAGHGSFPTPGGPDLMAERARWLPDCLPRP